MTAIIFLIIWLYPIVRIAKSNKTSGLEKLAWITAVIFISWFAWIVYVLVAPVYKKDLNYED